MPYLVGAVVVALVFVIIGIIKLLWGELKFFDIFQLVMLYIIACVITASAQTSLSPIVYGKKTEQISSQPLISFELNGKEVVVVKQPYTLSEKAIGSRYTFYTTDENGFPNRNDRYTVNDKFKVVILPLDNMTGLVTSRVVSTDRGSHWILRYLIPVSNLELWREEVLYIHQEDITEIQSN